MSKREDLLALASAVELASEFGVDAASTSAVLCGKDEAIKRGHRLIDRAIVKASRELRGAR